MGHLLAVGVLMAALRSPDSLVSVVLPSTA